MPRSGITYEQVADAANALRDRQERPTIRAVRRWLGEGSPNTIHGLLKRWQDEQARATSQETLPEALRQAIIEALTQRAEAARAASAQALADSEINVDVLVQQNDALEKQIGELTAQVHTLQDALAVSRGRAEKAEEDTASAQEHIEHAQARTEQARISAAQAGERVEALRIEIDKLHKANRALDTQNATLHERLTNQAQLLQASERRHAVAEARLIEVSGQLEQEKNVRAATEAAAGRLREELAVARGSLVASEQVIQRSETRIEQLETVQENTRLAVDAERREWRREQAEWRTTERDLRTSLAAAERRADDAMRRSAQTD